MQYLQSTPPPKKNNNGVFIQLDCCYLEKYSV